MVAWIVNNKALFVLIIGNLVAILNGLLPYLPPCQTCTVLRKAVIVLRWILDLLAPTSAKDSPNTIKLPLTWSKPPLLNGVRNTKTITPSLGGLGIVLMLALAAPLAGGCATLWHHVYDCASAEAKKCEADLGQAVVILLESGNYEAALIGLAVRLGPDGYAIINCIVQDYLHPTGVMLAKLSPIASTHANEWIAKHGATK